MESLRPRLKIVYAFGVALVVAAVLALFVTPAPRLAPPEDRPRILIIALFSYVAFLAGLVVSSASILSWLYASWAGVPVRVRRKRSPALQALLLLVPGFNLVWMFVTTVGLARALDEALGQAAAKRRVNLDWPIIASCTTLVCVPISPLAWLMYMSEVDAAQRELARSSR